MNHYIYYTPQHPILYKQIFDGCLEKYGVTTAPEFDMDSDLRMLRSKASSFEDESCVEVIPVGLKNAEFRINESFSYHQQTFILNALELQFGTTLKPHKPLCKKEETVAGPIFHDVNMDEIESVDQRFYKKILLSMLSQEYWPTEHDSEIMKFRIAMTIINASPQMLYPENYETLIKQTNEQWKNQRAEESIDDYPF